MFKCNAFPLLDTYMKALTHENNVKPIRGTEMKPIHLRGHKYMQIKTLSNGDVVYFNSWNGGGHPDSADDWVVKWKENGEIHVQAPMYNCVYEQLTSLLGINFFRQANALWVHTHTTLKLRPAFTQDPSVFKWKDGRLEYTNPPAITQKAIDRGVAKAVRKKYQVIYDYLRSMTKVRDAEYANSELAEAFDIELQDPRWHISRNVPRMSDRDAIVERISLAMEGDVSELYKLMLICASENGFVNYWNQESPLRCPPSKVVKAFDDFILRLHREEVFYDKEVPRGKMPNQTNNKFFN